MLRRICQLSPSICFARIVGRHCITQHITPSPPAVYHPNGYDIVSPIDLNLTVRFEGGSGDNHMVWRGVGAQRAALIPIKALSAGDAR
jgi:hypothetical protein